MIFDEEIDFMTKDGFKSISDFIVGKKEKIMCVDKELEMHSADCLINNINEENKFIDVYEGRDINVKLFENQKLLHYKNNTHVLIKKFSLDVIGTKTPIKVLTYPESIGCEFGYDIEEELLEMCVCIFTDGTFKYGTGGRKTCCRFYKSPKRWGNDYFRDLCKRCKLQYSVIEREDGFNNGGFVFDYKFNVENSKKMCLLMNETKKTLPDWFKKLNRDQAKKVVTLWAKLDGHTDNTRYGAMKLQCDNYNIANDVQYVCYLAGYSSSISERYIGNNKKPTIYVIPYLRKNKNMCKFYLEKYNGLSYNVDIPEYGVVVRRNSKLYVMSGDK